MRVLITGMTAIQVGRSGQLHLASVPDQLAQALRVAGAEVDHRPVAPEEDVSDYDRVVICLGNPTSFGALHIYSALDLLDRVDWDDVWLLVDDWRLKDVTNGLRSIYRDSRRLFKPIFDSRREPSLGSGRPDYDWAEHHKERLAAVVSALHTEQWPRLIWPRFEWGDPRVLEDQLPARGFLSVDPSYFTPKWPIDWKAWPARERAWLSGALSDNDKWLERQGFEWPVRKFGRHRQGQPRLKEPEFVKEYGKHWGALSQPYYHAGSGWWRVRFLHAMWGGAILYADPKEVAGLDPSYEKLGDVEILSDQDLIDLGLEQRDALVRQLWGRDRLVETLREAVL